MNDEGLADVEAASPFRLPRLHPGIVCRIRQAMGLAEGVEHSLGEGACIPRLILRFRCAYMERSSDRATITS